MSVSRLNFFSLASAQATVGYAPAANQYISPINGRVTFIVSGDSTGLSVNIEVYDGATWVALRNFTINANGDWTWTGAALGVRSNVTAITGGKVTIVAVLQDNVG